MPLPSLSFIHKNRKRAHLVPQLCSDKQTRRFENSTAEAAAATAATTAATTSQAKLLTNLVKKTTNAKETHTNREIIKYA